MLWACSRFGSAGDGVPADAGDGEAGARDATEPNAISFNCPAPARSCAFRTQSCCVVAVDGGVAGTCIAAGEHCAEGATSAHVFCDQRGPCQVAFDALAATCCEGGGITACGL